MCTIMHISYICTYIGAAAGHICLCHVYGVLFAAGLAGRPDFCGFREAPRGFCATSASLREPPRASARLREASARLREALRGSARFCEVSVQDSARLPRGSAGSVREKHSSARLREAPRAPRGSARVLRGMVPNLNVSPAQKHAFPMQEHAAAKA